MRWRVVTRIAAAAAVSVAVTIAAAAQSRSAASRFPNVTLTTQDGAAVRFYDDLIKGKIVAINLIYTTCRYACPLETARLAQVQRVLGDRMGRDVFFYSITIDPDHDTPEVLKEYAAKFHAGVGWLFLTGKREDIDLISRKMGLSIPTDPSDPDGHVPALLIGNDATGQWMRNSSLDNPRFLARTIGDWLASWQGPKRALTSYAEAPRFTIERGEYMFRTHCAACHTVGQGDRIGPDLLGVTNTRTRAWLFRFILAPDKVLAEGDLIATSLFARFKNVPMPNLALTPEDVDVVVDYLEQRTAAAAAAPTAATASAAATATTLPFVESYLRIQEALSADRLERVKDAARSIEAAAAKVGSGAEPIRSAAAELHEAGDLKSVRAAFDTLSDAIITYAKASNVTLGDGVNVAYCPMLRKHWLQKGTKIRNPFYGQQMLECGRITGSPETPEK